VYKDVIVTPDTPDLHRMRRDYRLDELLEADLAADWHTQFTAWLADVVAAGLPEPNAMVLATATADGRPSARTVLLKGVDERGFTFYTNYRSRKAGELDATGSASLLFPWHAIQRQVIVTGRAVRTSRAETESYFRQRPRGSQLGAWASPQSQPIDGRMPLERAWAEYDARFPEDVPAPEHWGGYRVVPETVEFWQGRSSRLHDRLRFRRTPMNSEKWTVERLAP
jgi:pyridoxamine 5'-phosphate oxidase